LDEFDIWMNSTPRYKTFAPPVRVRASSKA
jgi:hypothetical protein